MRRLMIFAVSAAVGLSLAAMSRGEWPQAGKPGGAIIGASSRVSSEKAEIMAGLTRVEGPGIRIRIDDAAKAGRKDVPIERLIVHERDLMLLRNELFAAGAEAVSINGLRMVAKSVIRCVGPAIRINDSFTSPPYVIEAAGDPETLKQAVMMMDGVIDVISAHNLKVDVAQLKNVAIPAYSESGAAKADSPRGGAK